MGLNVVVVDDSAVMRAMIIRTLRTSRVALHEIHEAADAVEALAVLEDHWVDLALIDLNMPGMTGEELIERIRANPATAGVAVLVISAEDRDARITAIRDNGAAFLQKPFTLEALRAEIERVTGMQRAIPAADAVTIAGAARHPESRS